MNQKCLIVPIAYFPAINYFSLYTQFQQVYIEKYENFTKQSLRTRCEILSSNGVQRLIVPVLKTHGEKMPISEVVIDYSLKWQHQHSMAIVSAYKNSPYFEYYWHDYIEPILLMQPKYLIDLNISTLEVMLKLFKIKGTHEMSCSYSPISQTSCSDYRYKELPVEMNLSYKQVFHDRHPFVANLSSLDLLFCCGPESIFVL